MITAANLADRAVVVVLGTVLASFTLLFSVLIYAGLRLASQTLDAAVMLRTYLVVSVEASFIVVIFYFSFWMFRRTLKPISSGLYTTQRPIQP